MSYKCPSCGSDQTANLKVAQARETRTGTFGGVGVDSGGGVGVMGGRTTETSSFGAGLQAGRVTADESTLPATLIAWLGTIGGLIGFMVATMSDPKSGKGPIGWIVCALGGALIVAALIWQSKIRSRNDNPHRAAYEAKQRVKWNAQWVCYQCGSKFMPAESV